MTTLYGDGAESMVRRRVKRVALVGGDADDLAFIWQNPEDKKIIVTRVVVDRTVAGGTVGSVLDVGIVANPTSTSDNLIDGLDLDTTGVADNISDAGVNGKSRGKVDENGGTYSYITGTILTANASNLEGYVYIEYFLVED